MAGQLGFRDFRKAGDIGPDGNAGEGAGGLGNVERREPDGPLAGRADFEDEGLADFPDHDTASLTAAARRSISARVESSVTQIKAAFLSSG